MMTGHMFCIDICFYISVYFRSVIESLPSDTILFVLGDHGMTVSGDHGGDSSDEITSALFVFSPSRLWDTLVK